MSLSTDLNLFARLASPFGVFTWAARDGHLHLTAHTYSEFLSFMVPVDGLAPFEETPLDLGSLKAALKGVKARDVLAFEPHAVTVNGLRIPLPPSSKEDPHTEPVTDPLVSLSLDPFRALLRAAKACCKAAKNKAGIENLCFQQEGYGETTDGHRLYQSGALTTGPFNETFLFPGWLVPSLDLAASKAESVTLREGKTDVRFSFRFKGGASAVLQARKVDSVSWPQTGEVIRQALEGVKVEVNGASASILPLLGAIKGRVGKKEAMRLTLQPEGGLSFEGGEVKGDVFAVVDGLDEPRGYGFNPAYLEFALKGYGPSFEMGLGGALQPAVLRDLASPGFWVVMPMRLDD